MNRSEDHMIMAFFMALGLLVGYALLKFVNTRCYKSPNPMEIPEMRR